MNGNKEVGHLIGKIRKLLESVESYEASFAKVMGESKYEADAHNEKIKKLEADLQNQIQITEDLGDLSSKQENLLFCLKDDVQKK